MLCSFYQKPVLCFNKVLNPPPKTIIYSRDKAHSKNVVNPDPRPIFFFICSRYNGTLEHSNFIPMANTCENHEPSETQRHAHKR